MNWKRILPRTFLAVYIAIAAGSSIWIMTQDEVTTQDVAFVSVIWGAGGACTYKFWNPPKE